MGEIAAWIAPIATTIAACVTAANLGSRITGWGFVIFTVGSVAWTLYGLATGQPNLLWQNVLLTLVNLFGVWRWLIRRASIEDWTQAVAERSEALPGPTFIPMTTLTGASVVGRDGVGLGTVVDAMVDCENGRMGGLVVSSGAGAGANSALHLLPWRNLVTEDERILTDLSERQFAALEVADPSAFPTPPFARR